MNKNILSKTLVLGIILLFIGVGIQSALAVENRVSTDSIEEEEDCDCQEDISNPYMVKLWLNKLGVLTNILSKRFGHIPEFKEECQELKDVINSFKHSIVRPICNMLKSLNTDFFNKISYYWEKYVETDWIFYAIIAEIYYQGTYLTDIFYYLFLCHVIV